MCNYYIALDHANLDWKPKDVHRVEIMWNNGLSLKEIARNIKRSHKDTFLLIYDRLELGHIKKREGSVFGNESRKQTKTSC